MQMCLVGAHPLPPVALCFCLTLEVFEEHLDVALEALVSGRRLDSVIPEVFPSLTLGSFPSSGWLLRRYPRNPRVISVKWKEVSKSTGKGHKG